MEVNTICQYILTKKITDIFKNLNAKEVYKGSTLVWNKSSLVTDHTGYFYLTVARSSNDSRIYVNYIPKAGNSSTALGSVGPGDYDGAAFIYQNYVIYLNNTVSTLTYTVYEVRSTGLVQNNNGTVSQITGINTTAGDLDYIYDFDKGYLYVATGHFSKTLSRAKIQISSGKVSLIYDNDYGTVNLNKGSYNNLSINTPYYYVYGIHSINFINSYNVNYPYVLYSYGTNGENKESFNLETKQYATYTFKTPANLENRIHQEILVTTPRDFTYTCDYDSNSFRYIYSINRDTLIQSQIGSYPYSKTSGREDGVRVETKTNNSVYLVGYDLIYIDNQKTYYTGTSSRDPIDYYTHNGSVVKISTGATIKTVSYKFDRNDTETCPQLPDGLFCCPWTLDSLFTLCIATSETSFIFKQDLTNKDDIIVSPVNVDYDRARGILCPYLGYVRN